MNICLHQIAESPINHLMPLDLAFAFEGIGDDERGEMPATTLHGTRMTRMRGTVIANIKLHWRQGLLQHGPNFFDTITHCGNTCLKGLMMTRA